MCLNKETNCAICKEAFKPVPRSENDSGDNSRYCPRCSRYVCPDCREEVPTVGTFELCTDCIEREFGADRDGLIAQVLEKIDHEVTSGDMTGVADLIEQFDLKILKEYLHN